MPTRVEYRRYARQYDASKSVRFTEIARHGTPGGDPFTESKPIYIRKDALPEGVVGFELHIEVDEDESKPTPAERLKELLEEALLVIEGGGEK